MDNFDLSIYCSSFLKDKSLGDLVFYKDHNKNFTYNDLMQSVLSQAKKNTSTFSALKMKSSYQLFIHLLAGSITQKNLIILSEKEPTAAIVNYKKQLNFDNVISDEAISKNPREEFSTISIDMNRPAFYILSSGTSGPSKSIGLSLNNIYYSAKSVIDFFNITSSDCTFLNLPHHHIGGLMILWRAFFSRSSVTVNEEDYYEFISLVPLQLKRFLKIPDKLNKLKNCRGVLIGGAILDGQLKAEALAQNISLFETYGMSETSSLVMLNGSALKGQTVKLDSNNHILIKGPTLSSQVPRDEDGFFRTKDIGTANQDGTISFKQRGDLLFKSAGELIDPLEIEDKVKSIAWITNAVLVPVNHFEWTNAGCLVYQSSDQSKSSEDILAHLKKVLHPHHIPKYFYEAPKNLFSDGIKPKRYEILKWAQENYFKSLIHYQHYPGSDEKRLIVFFHGFMEDHSDLLELKIDQPDLSFLFIDIPGHGKSDSRSFNNRNDVFTTLENLIKFYQNNNELIFYGYSMGGRLALELAALYLQPQLLILESAHFGLETVNLKNERLIADYKLFSETNMDLELFFKKWYSNPIFSNYNQTPNYPNDLQKKICFNSSQWQMALRFFSPGLSPLLQSEMVKKVKDFKMVGITGSEDLKYSDHYKIIKSDLSHFTHLEIKQAGHNPHKTHPNELKEILHSTLYKISK